MTLFFMHITKTAGGSVKEMLKQSAVDVTFHYLDEPGYRKWFWYRPAPEIIYGHFPWGVHRHAGLPPRYAAFFREPTSRTISHYLHLINVDPSETGDEARRYGSFEDYISGGRRWEFDNFMCRSVSGVANRLPFGAVDASVLETAIANLERDFVYVGIFEQLELSVQRLNSLIPALQAELPVVNKGTYNQPLSDRDRSIAADLNVYDAILYQRALELFAG